MRRFLLIFVAVELGLLGLELLNPVQQYFVLPFTTLLAKFCAWLVTMFDSSAASAGKVLWNPTTGFGVSIEPGCNGIEAMITLFAAIMAFPSTWKHRLVGFFWGTVAIQLLNVVRVISLFYLGQWNTEVFKIAHEYLWQALIMIDVLVVWLIWVRSNPRQWVDSGHGPQPESP